MAAIVRSSNVKALLKILSSMTDYVLVECMAKCPQSRRAINEKILAEVE
jgi:hypothetical protein